MLVEWCWGWCVGVGTSVKLGVRGLLVDGWCVGVLVWRLM